MNIFTKNGSINIDGKSFKGNSVSIVGNTVIVDGVAQSGVLPSVVHVVVHGDCEAIENHNGNVSINGNAGAVKVGVGDVQCGDVAGDVKIKTGDISCGKVVGSVKTSVGDIIHQ